MVVKNWMVTSEGGDWLALGVGGVWYVGSVWLQWLWLGGLAGCRVRK